MMLSYLAQYWPEAIGLSLASSVLLSTVMAVIVVYCAQALTIFFELLAIGVTIYLWISYSSALAVENSNLLGYKISKSDAANVTNLLQTQLNSKIFFISAIVASVITILVAILILCFRKNISAFVKQFNEARHVIKKVPCILVQPLVTSIFQISLFMYVFAIGVYLFTIVIPVTDKRGFVSFELVNKNMSTLLFTAELLGCCWVFQFMLACEYIIIAGALADWYFKRQHNACCPTKTPTLYLLCYQLGTAAYGSLVVVALTVVQEMLKLLKRLKYLIKGLTVARKKFRQKRSFRKNDMGGRNRYFYIENLLFIVNNHAYICAAIFGSSFYDSGQRAEVLLKHSSKSLLGWLQTIIFLSSKIAVVIFTAMVVSIYFRYRLGPEASIFGSLLLVVVAEIIALVFAKVYFNAFDQTMTTMFFCDAEDTLRHNGQALYVKEEASGSLYPSLRAQEQREVLYPSALTEEINYEEIEKTKYDNDFLPIDGGDKHFYAEEEQQRVF